MQPGGEVDTRTDSCDVAHEAIVPRQGLVPRGTLGRMGTLLTSRRHVDLQRVSSSLCSQG